jgi:autotransporter-associated beta strand protein
MKKLFPVFYVISCLIAAHSFAGSATWSSNPISRDWNTAENWTPNTVPNSPTDVATFDTSAVTKITLTIPFSISINYLASMIFNPGADSFSIHAVRAQNLQISGDGIVNNSGKTQEFLMNAGGSIYFGGAASAGDLTSFTVVGGAAMIFSGTATAGTAHFIVSDYGHVDFFEGTAGNATFDIGIDGSVDLSTPATAANATFNIAGGTLTFDFAASAEESVIDCSEGGQVIFQNLGTGIVTGSPQVTAHGASSSYERPGSIHFAREGRGDQGTYVVEGGTSELARGGTMYVLQSSDLQNAHVTVMGGTSGGDGGSILFSGYSTGGHASITMSGNATFQISNRKVDSLTIGSIDGEGSFLLGPNQLILGNNNLSTTFSGTIADGDEGPGSLSKIGTRTFTLSGANTYSNGTTVTAGALIVSNTTGSATGTGNVTVQAGTLGGTGIIAGPTIIGSGSGTGSFLQPGVGASNAITLTMQNPLTCKGDSTYVWKLNTDIAEADEVAANGVTIQAGAHFDLSMVGNTTLIVGQAFTAISNTAATAISGTFANLADGSTVTLGVNKLQASYSGGDGNDLTLTVVQ